MIKASSNDNKESGFEAAILLQKAYYHLLVDLTVATYEIKPDKSLTSHPSKRGLRGETSLLLGP